MFNIMNNIESKNGEMPFSHMHISYQTCFSDRNILMLQLNVKCSRGINKIPRHFYYLQGVSGVVDTLLQFFILNSL